MGPSSLTFVIPLYLLPSFFFSLLIPTDYKDFEDSIHLTCVLYNLFLTVGGTFELNYHFLFKPRLSSMAICLLRINGGLFLFSLIWVYSFWAGGSPSDWPKNKSSESDCHQHKIPWQLFHIQLINFVMPWPRFICCKLDHVLLLGEDPWLVYKSN